ASPSSVRPQVCAYPAPTAAKRNPPATANGSKLRSRAFLSPRLAISFDPQQYALSSIATPHVWRYPALIDLKRSSVSTGVGVRLILPLEPSWASFFGPQQ